jgi:hypothetical protein
MRRSLIVVGLLVVMLMSSATPVLADRRKSTITLGVDPDGVAIQIDADLSGEGRASGGSKAGTGSCTYVPASVGLEELYSQQGANLFSITCGSYTDVRLLRTGADGQPLLPGPRVDPFQLALSARDRLPVPQGAIEANPTRSLVGLPTFFWYSGYDGRSLTRTVSAFGVSVEVEATPTSYRWTFGDGASLTSAGLGRAYPARSPIAHTYQTAREEVTVHCRFGFAVRWRTGGGPWAPLAPLTRTANTTLEVAESQTVIAQ